MVRSLGNASVASRSRADGIFRPASMNSASLIRAALAITLVMAFSLKTSGLAMTATGSRGPKIAVEDVYRFYQLYDASGGHPSADQLQNEYLDPGSEGLHNLAKARNVTGARIAENIAKHPEIYSGARQCVDALPRVRHRVG